MLCRPNPTLPKIPSRGSFVSVYKLRKGRGRIKRACALDQGSKIDAVWRWSAIDADMTIAALNRIDLVRLTDAV